MAAGEACDPLLARGSRTAFQCLGDKNVRDHAVMSLRKGDGGLGYVDSGKSLIARHAGNC